MSKIEDTGKKEQKRNSIIKAALKVFSKKGYSPAALDEVAKEADIAKGTIYLYFHDKEDLFYSTMMNVIDRLAKKLKETIDEKMDPFETLEKIAFCQLDFFSKNRDFFGLFQTILNSNIFSNHEKLFHRLKEGKDILFNFEKNVIEKGKKEGLIRTDINTKEIVYCYDGMVMSSIKLLVHNGDKYSLKIEDKIESIKKILFEGISNTRK